MIAVADTCSRVDVAALRTTLDEGSARAGMMRRYRAHVEDVQGSPHCVLPDGYEVHNPGMSLHWEEGGRIPRGRRGRPIGLRGPRAPRRRLTRRTPPQRF